MAKGRRRKGLGDVVADITKSVGVEPCEGCKERQFTLNRLFPFKQVSKEMTQEHKESFALFMQSKGNRVIEGKTTTLDAKEVQFLNELYLEYFGLDNSNCPNCSGIHKTIIKDLFKLSNYEKTTITND